VKTGDGALGWPEAAPFDRVLLTAAARTVPQSLLAQLRDGGLFVGPVERSDGSQELVRLTRSGNTFSIERLADCAFVPMVRPSSAADERRTTLGEPYGR
jgi:protein-L-isoaspartate(D-aspartate) O-methyltransferase